MSGSERNIRRIGFIGLGAIGGPMADRIIGAGLAVSVFDIRHEALTSFEGRARIGCSPRDIADWSDVVFACLVTPDSYRQVVFGKDGIVRGRRARTYVHVGTSGAPFVAELAEQLASEGWATIDAPITGGRARACDGTLTAMVSGPSENVTALALIMSCYANRIVYLGRTPGSAQVMKVVNNVVSLGNLVLASEALVIGAKAGLSPEAMLDVLNNGSGQNSATLSKIPQSVLTRTFDYGGSLSVEVKDLNAFVAQAETTGVNAPLGRMVRDIYLRAMELGSPSDDVTTVIRHMENAAGVRIEAPIKV